MSKGGELRIPTLAEIEGARRQLGDLVRRTPVWEWRGGRLGEAVGPSTRVYLKLELFQFAGSFKPRGALLNLLALDPQQRQRGVTAVSAGNHAMAVGFAARAVGTTAKVVMPRSSNPARVAGCRRYGVELVLAEDIFQAFAEVRRIEREEGRALIHPFEGFEAALGSGTLGLELHRQVRGLDAVVVPIGGGGLCAGVAVATRLVGEGCRVIGVEPEGADTMHRSFAAGRPVAIDGIKTIADSLGAPCAEPYSFGLCRRFVDELVMIDDNAIRRAMRLLAEEMKLVVEPAGAAATAALCGPLGNRLRGQRVGVIVCGSNIDLGTFQRLLGYGELPAISR